MTTFLSNVSNAVLAARNKFGLDEINEISNYGVVFFSKRDIVNLAELNETHFIVNNDIPVGGMGSLEEYNNELKYEEKTLDIERKQTSIYNEASNIAIRIFYEMYLATKDDKNEIIYNGLKQANYMDYSLRAQDFWGTLIFDVLVLENKFMERVLKNLVLLVNDTEGNMDMFECFNEISA